jgi:gliding motility-associated-like protein
MRIIMKKQFLVILFFLYHVVTLTNANSGYRDDHPDIIAFKAISSTVTMADDVPRDYGDAPVIYGSADHSINSKVCLGSFVDAEPAHQPSEEADADDLNGIDDEDGVTFPEMIQGKRAAIQVKVTGLAYLNIWIDWNCDGDFLDNDEYILKNSLRYTGVHTITVNVPENGIISKPTYARFRFGPSASVKPVYSSSGSAGTGEVEDYMIKIHCIAPSPPKVESVTQPNCEELTGSVLLSELPEPGAWTLTRLPDGETTKGKGKTVLISSLQTGIYRYLVTNDKGCISAPSEEITINKSPPVPIAPLIGKITQPDCQLPAGSVVLNGLPESRPWELVRYPDNIVTKGSGITIIIEDLSAGTYYFRVTNSDGCTSLPSDDFVINPQPHTPSVPLVGSITQPTCSVSSGSVELEGLPASGDWILTRLPDNVITTGAGTGITITGLDPGTYNYTVTNSEGCTSAPSGDIVITEGATTPAPPVINTITQPTCTRSTGQVVLTGLPATGTWTLFRYPDGITVKGTGISITVSDMTAGTYNFNVTSSEGCASARSSDVIIEQQPPTPSEPVVNSIIQPSCTAATGSVVLTGLPQTGTWTLTRYPGTIKTSGSGPGITITGLGPGTYNFTVTNASGCTSPASANILITVQPATPSAPVVGTITQPTCIVATGSVVLKSLPSQGTWTLIRFPDSKIVTGSGTSITLRDLLPGTYNFTVTNYVGCTSVRSSDVVIDPQPATTPVISITNPQPACSPETVNLTNPAITEGSTEGLIFTYWKDPQATIPYNTPSQATAGTWYIKGTTSLGCYGIQPVRVEVYPEPEAHAGPDQILKYKFDSQLDANYPDEYSTGKWSIISGSGTFSDDTEAKTYIENLAVGRNILMWRMDNKVCPPAEDYIVIMVNDLVIPTLIIPDMDGRNDYFILEGIESLGKTEIVIFDRRGMLVYKNDNYDNSWYGLDNKGHPLPGDTYFYVFRSETGFSNSGFIVVKR